MAGILFIVFLVLKLAEVGVVAKWVTSPLWIPFCLVFVYLIFASWARDWR